MKHHDYRRDRESLRDQRKPAARDYFLQERISALLRPSSVRNARRRQRQPNASAK